MCPDYPSDRPPKVNNNKQAIFDRGFIHGGGTIGITLWYVKEILFPI